MSSAPLHTPKPIPLDRAIPWRPLQDAYFLLGGVLGRPTDDYAVFLRQPVLIGLELLMRRLAGTPSLGLLTGIVGECPDTRARYSIIDAAIPATDAPGGWIARGYQVFDQAHEAAAAHIREHGGEILGWYRSRPDVGTQLSPGDERICRERYSAPWQVVLVVTPYGDGAVFRYKEIASRSYLAPFYELLSRPPRPGLPAKTAIAWRSYQPALKVSPMSEAEKAAIVSRGEATLADALPSVKERLRELGHRVFPSLFPTPPT